MWGPKPAEAIIDSIHAKGYIRTFTPLATMLLALAGTAMYVANYGTKARNLRKDQSSSSEPGQFQAVQERRMSPARRLAIAREKKHVATGDGQSTVSESEIPLKSSEYARRTP